MKKEMHFFEKGDYESAITSYDKAIKINKKYIDAYYNRGICYLKLQLNEQACKDLNQAASLGDKSVQELMDKFCK